MKHIKKFENYQKNESSFFLGAPVGLLIIYGALVGFAKISNLINYVKFKRAKNKLNPIFDKIKNDEKIMSLLNDLYKYKDVIYDYFGKEEGELQRPPNIFQIRDSIYKRAQELLDSKEYKIFTSAAKEFEINCGEPAGYFIDKDSKFSRWGETI